MAQKTLIIRIDDLTGEELTDDNGQTLTFGLDGTTYEIDLLNETADELRETLDTYIAVSRKVVGSRPARSAAKASGPSAKAVRAWAVEQGLDVPARGRLPREITDAYRAAN